VPDDDAGPAAFDVAALTRIRAIGGERLLGEMIALFSTHAPARVAAAKAGFRSADPKAIEAATHALKSSAAQLGATELSTLAARAEVLAHAGDLPSVQPILDRLDEALPAAVDWMRSTTP
jgi:HPt (histidine-containing phosphotransfer) domain-containing protein